MVVLKTIAVGVVLHGIFTVTIPCLRRCADRHELGQVCGRQVAHRRLEVGADGGEQVH
jgi:hypothetical protein